MDQIRETVDAVRSHLARAHPWRLGFQSRTGPVRWIGPGTDELLRGDLADSAAVVVVPISFVSDHIETLYEIDILFARIAREAGIGRFVRCASLNDSPGFIRALADVVEPVL